MGDKRLAIPEISAILERSGFFGKGQTEIVRSIAEFSRTESYSKGEVIFEEDAVCSGMYVVAEGAVKVYKIGPDGREHVIHVAEPYETFAEAAMFLGARGFPAYAAAIKASTVVFIPKLPLLELLEREPRFCIHLLGSLASWTHRLVAKLELLTLKDASSRLAGYLIGRTRELGDGAVEFDLSIPKSTLAAQLAISSETFSRLLTRFEAQELIDVAGKHIRILDREGLQEVADWGASEG